MRVFGFFTNFVLILHSSGGLKHCSLSSTQQFQQSALLKADRLFSLHELFGLCTYLFRTPISIYRPSCLLRNHKDLWRAELPRAMEFGLHGVRTPQRLSPGFADRSELRSRTDVQNLCLRHISVRLAFWSDRRILHVFRLTRGMNRASAFSFQGKDS